MHDINDKGVEMRLEDLAFANVPASAEGSAARGTRRLLRDLVSAGLMQQERPTAAERLELTLGRDLVGVLRTSLFAPKPVHGLRAHRAA
ncbi:MAG TPA: hypothetical protein VLJ76_03835 [Gaiellaceae bacterium]|nr:hypothetical protein [Gaiellaceae bacterium]